MIEQQLRIKNLDETSIKSVICCFVAAAR